MHERYRKFFIKVMVGRQNVHFYLKWAAMRTTGINCISKQTSYGPSMKHQRCFLASCGLAIYDQICFLSHLQLRCQLQQMNHLERWSDRGAGIALKGFLGKRMTKTFYGIHHLSSLTWDWNRAGRIIRKCLFSFHSKSNRRRYRSHEFFSPKILLFRAYTHQIFWHTILW